MQAHRLLGAKKIAIGNAEEQGVTDIAGSAGNSNADRAAG
jgi:hypothetical protein